MNNCLLLVAFGIAFIITGCRRTEKEDIGGKGGNVTLKIIPQHHGKNIDSCKVYIKYNSSDAATSYDDSVNAVNENGKPVATFSQLKKGKYYILGKGWDPTITDNVKGGMPQTITEERTHELALPVTEE